MNSCHWFRVSGCIVSAILLALSGGVQVAAEQASSVAGQASFVTAPIVPLSYSPSSMAVGDLNGDGKPDLVTADWDAGKVTVSLGLGDGSFAAGVDYAAGDHPTSIILADVDGDGCLDLIAANASDGTVSVLLGNGNGQFKQLQTYKLGFNSSLLAIGDFSGSGRSDLIAVDAALNRFALLLNDGKGGFGEPALHALGKTPAAVTVADLNHDGHPDLAFANSDGSISILWGSKGSFQAGPLVSVAQGPLSAILAGDFNHDGVLDLAVTIPGSKQLAILTGKGDGSFAAPVRYSVGANPVAIISADVDEDGIADLIVTNQGSNTFSVLGGNSDGSFRTALDFVSGKGPTAAVAGDFNNDGHLDLAMLNHDAQSLSLPLGNGDGTFLAARAYSVEMQPRSVAAGDLAGNKRSDLVVTNFCGSDPSCAKAGSVSVLVAGESNSYHLASNYVLGAGPVAVALLDVDGDKNLDIVALNRADKTISVLLGLGSASFQQQFTLPLANAPIAFAAGDFNHDGKTDLAVIGDCGAAKCTQPGTLEILYGSSDGGFQTGPSYPVGFAPSSVTVADLNSDKNLDIVVANSCGNSAACAGAGTASVFLGGANGRFTAAQTLGLGKNPSSIALADLSGRGTPDLLVSGASDNTLALLRGNGDGSFGAAIVYAVGAMPGAIAVADFNGDGKLDVAVGNVADSTVSVLYGKGDGTLLAGFIAPVGPGPAALATLGSGSSKRAGLATANGSISASTSAAMAGSDITVLTNIHPADDPTGTQTTTVLTPAPNPSSTTVNQSVTLSATVTGTEEGGPPTGTVTFNSSPNALTDCTPTSTPGTISTVWSCTTQSLQAPSQSITAVYSGDSTYAGSTSAAVVEAVAPESANFVFDSFSPSPATVDEAVTLISKVVVSLGKITPQGTVKFTVNGTVACNSIPVTVQSGVVGANCVTQALLASIPTNTVSVTYSGDKNFSIPNLAVSGGLSINQATLTVTAQSSAPTASVNQPVTFSAALTLPAGGVPSPTQATGTVTFVQGATTLCTAAVNPSLATATCSPVTFSAATALAGVTISATYSGDGNFSNQSTAGTTTQIVKADPTTTAVGPTAASAIDQQVTFTATVTPTYPSSTAAPLAGKVSFTDTTTNTPMCSSVTLTAGSASCPYKFPSAGPQTVTIAFTPTDSTQFAVSSTTATQQVNASDVSLGLTANPQTLSVNEKTTLTTTITSQSGSGTPIDGTVTITDGSPTNILCQNLTITGDVVQTCPVTFGSPGNHTLTATYTPGKSGDFNPATFMLPLTITPDGTSTALGLAPGSVNPSVVNQSVSITATVTPGFTGVAAMGGTVTFTDTPPSGTPISLCTAVPVTTVTSSGPTITSATASCPTAFVSLGKHSVTASYTSGNTNYGSSTASAITQTVNADMTNSATSVSFSAAATVNATMQVTTTITPVNFGVAPPTGTVQFSAQNTVTKSNITLCNSVPVTASGSSTMATGTAVCNYAALPAASYSISSVYTNTDGDFAGSSSSANQTITAAPTSVVVTSSNPTPIATQTVTLVATVTPTPHGSVAIVPGGTVSFSATGDAAAASALVASCTKIPVAASTSGTVTANCPVAFSSSDSGPVTVQAVYNPDSNFTGSTSGPPATQPFTIQDFSLNSSASSLFVAQGYSNTTNPFANVAPFSSQSLTVSRTLIGGFADPLSLSCAVHSVSVDSASVSSGTSPTIPTCRLSTTSLNAGDQSTPVTLAVMSATTDAVGQYAVTVTVNDTSIATLSHAITVNVVVAQVEGTLSLGSGSSGSADLLFATPINPSSGTPPTLVSVSCNSILSQTPGNAVNGIACTAGSATTIIPATSTSNGLVQVPITIVAGAPSGAGGSASSAIHGGIHIGALWAMPLVAFVIWLFGGRSARKSYLRYFILLGMAVGLLGGVGCGGSFSAPPQAKGTASGYYTIQVVASYSDGSSSAAVVNIFVAASE